MDWVEANANIPLIEMKNKNIYVGPQVKPYLVHKKIPFVILVL